MNDVTHVLREWIDALRRRRWLSIALGSVAFGLLVFGWVVVPRAHDAVAAVEAWQAKKARIAAAAQWKQRLRALEREQSAYRSQLDSLYVHVPRGDRISAVLDALQTRAEQSGVTLYAVRPGAPEAMETYEKLPLNVDVRGGFHPVARFVDRVERMAYLVVVDRLSIAPVPTDATTSSTSDGALTATLRLGLVTLRADATSDAPSATAASSRTP